MVPATRATPDTVTLAVIDELKRRDIDQTERLERQAETIGTLKAEAAELRRQLDEARQEKANRRWWHWLTTKKRDS